MNISVWICLPKSGVKLAKIWMYMPISHISFSNNRALQIFIKCFLLHIWKLMHIWNTEKLFHLKFVKVARVVEIDSFDSPNNTKSFTSFRKLSSCFEIQGLSMTCQVSSKNICASRKKYPKKIVVSGWPFPTLKSSNFPLKFQKKSFKASSIRKLNIRN